MTIQQTLASAQAAIVRGEWARATTLLERVKRRTKSRRLKVAADTAARITARRIA